MINLLPWQRTLYVVWISQFVALAGASLVFPFLPLYVEHLGVQGEGRIAFFGGLAGSAAGMTIFLTAPIWGAISDRVGRKPMLLRAYLGGAVCFVFMGFVQNVWQLVLLRALNGLFTGSVSAASALVAANTPEERVGYSLGMIQVSVFTGGIIGPVIGGLMADSLGFRATFVFTGAAYGVAGLLLLIGVRENFTPPTEQLGPVQTMRKNMRDVAGSPLTLTMVGMIFLINATTGLVRPVIPIFVGLLSNGSAARNSGYVFAALAVTSAGAAMIAGNMGHRVGFRRLLLFALAGVGITYIPVAASNSMATLLLTMALVGCFSGAMLPPANALLSLSTPAEKQGSAFGLAGSASALASATGPLLGGAIASALGVRSVFVVVGLFTLLVSVIALRNIKTPSRPENRVEEVEPQGRLSD